MAKNSLEMVQLRRIPLATISPASTPSLLKRWRLGRLMNEFIHSPVTASTDLLGRTKKKCSHRANEPIDWAPLTTRNNERMVTHTLAHEERTMDREGRVNVLSLIVFAPFSGGDGRGKRAAVFRLTEQRENRALVTRKPRWPSPGALFVMHLPLCIQRAIKILSLSRRTPTSFITDRTVHARRVTRSLFHRGGPSS